MNIVESHKLKNPGFHVFEGFAPHNLPLILEDTYHSSTKPLLSPTCSICTCLMDTGGYRTTTKALNFVAHAWHHGIGFANFRYGHGNCFDPSTCYIYGIIMYLCKFKVFKHV